MAFLAVLLALAAAQLLGSHAVHAPQLRHCAAYSRLWIWQVVWVAAPTVLVALLYHWLEVHLWLLALPFAAGVLWLCMGGTALAGAVEAYINAARGENWQAAQAAYQLINGQHPVAELDWQELNRAMLERTAYLSFSNVFAALFLFALLGPAGALGYRLACLSARVQPWPPMARLVWTLEWPAARLLGLTFAFTGNFLSCMHTWRGCVFCKERNSEQIITHYVLGALGAVESSSPSLAVTRREIAAMGRLMRRSLWFWVGALALAALAGW